jgi:hypothetical protein
LTTEPILHPLRSRRGGSRDINWSSCAIRMARNYAFTAGAHLSVRVPPEICAVFAVQRSGRARPLRVAVKRDLEGAAVAWSTA